MTRPSFAGDATGEPVQMPNHAAEYEPRIHPAAGPWEEGEPKEEDVYLCEVTCDGQKGHMLLSWDADIGFVTEIDIAVLRYAEIYPDDA